MTKEELLKGAGFSANETPSCGECGLQGFKGMTCAVSHYNLGRELKREDFDKGATHPRWCPLVEKED